MNYISFPLFLFKVAQYNPDENFWPNYKEISFSIAGKICSYTTFS